MRPWPQHADVCSGGKGLSGEGLEGGLDGRLVAFEREEVVAVVVIDDVAGVLGIGVRGVRGDDLAVEVTDLIEERTERGVLGRAVRDLGLADDSAAVVEQPGEQLDLSVAASGFVFVFSSFAAAMRAVRS